jgi:hypothetical protein
MLFEAEDGFFESPVPFQCRVGLPGVDVLVQAGKSRSAREVILTRYAIFGFELFEKLPRWPGAAMGYIV